MNDSMTFSEMYEICCGILRDAGNDCFRSDVDNIFRHCLNVDKAGLILNGNQKISSKHKEKILEITEKRRKGTPLQYLLGTWDFMGLEFNVGEGVLIPRDDTEVLVSASVEFLNGKDSLNIVDLCSGSGCVAIALEKILKNFPKISAIEISDKAFAYLKENISKHKSTVAAINEDIFTAFKKFISCSIDAVISNPPYVKTSELDYLQPEVRLEPHIALDGGEDGLDFYKKICKYWVPKLKVGGLLAFEIGIGQCESVKKLMTDEKLSNIRVIKDINNIDRVIMGIKQSRSV